LFEKSAANLLLAAELLQELISATDYAEHEKLYQRIKELELIGDQITDTTYHQLNKSFITPFDREDIHELTANIDDVVDSINGIARRICLYRPKKLLPVFDKMALMILEGARVIKTCIHCLNDAAANKNEITSSCDRIKEIEHKADDYYFVAVSELFEKEKDPSELLKNNKILEMLEKCVDEEEDVSDTIKAILIKMA